MYCTHYRNTAAMVVLQLISMGVPQSIVCMWGWSALSLGLQPENVLISFIAYSLVQNAPKHAKQKGSQWPRKKFTICVRDCAGKGEYCRIYIDSHTTHIHMRIQNVLIFSIFKTVSQDALQYFTGESLFY